MEEQQEQNNKVWRTFWTIFDVALFGAYFLLFLILIDPWGTVSYYDGLKDTIIMFGLAFVVFPSMFMLLCLIAIRLFFIKRSTKSRKSFFLLMLFVILFNPIFALMSPIRPPGYKPYTRGFHQRMQDRLNIEKIRDWLKTLDEEVFDGEYYDLIYQMNGNVLPFPLPKEITILSEDVHYLVFYKDDQGRCLRIEWGGAFGHWGVVIGPKEMEVPSSDFSKYGEYRIKLENGAYVWHELQ